MISTIGKYTVQAELGRGGFGRVYRAFDPDVQRQVAIKVLIAEGDADLLKRFQFEVGTTGNLRHKNIVTLYECGEESGVPYLVMELLEGQPLDVVIRNRASLSLLQKVRVMNQTAEGLAYAHSQGVIHRDVKPGNIMLLRDGSVKIMDFGIARAVKQSTMVTREGMIVGTVPYMAPELFEPTGRADEQADVFAYGAVCYELLTGVHPFSVEQDIYSTIRRIQQVEPDALGRVLPEAPEGLELLVHRAIAKDREVRYQNFSELLLDGEAVLVDLQRERAATLLAEVRLMTDKAAPEVIEAKLLEVVELDPGNREARLLRNTLRDRARKAGMGKRASSLLAQSETLVQNRQFAEAVQILENALRLNKEDSVIQSRLSQATARLRSHLEANKLVAEARRDQQRGLFPEALRRLVGALELDADHVDAKTLRPRLEAEIERRARQQAAQEALHRASELLDQGRFEEALAAVKPLEQEPGLVDQAQELRERIEQGKEAAERRRRSEQLRMAIVRVRETLQARDHERASLMLKLIEARFGDDQEAARTLAELRTQLDAQVRDEELSRELQQARELIGRNALREAIELLNSLQPRYPDDTTLRGLRESAEKSLAEQKRAERIAAAAQEASALCVKGEPVKALEVINRAQREQGDDPTLSDLAIQAAAEIQKQRYSAGLRDFLRRAEALSASGSHAEIIRAIEDSPQYQAEPQVKALLLLAKNTLSSRAESEAVEASRARARLLEGNGSPAAALEVLAKAQDEYPKAELARDIDQLRRRIALAKHKAVIGTAIEARDWRRAADVVLEARREFPGEQAFQSYNDVIRRGRFEDDVSEACKRVREELAGGRSKEAEKLLIEARALLGDDERFTSLDQEVARWIAYETEVQRAEQYLEHDDLDGAEWRLQRIVRDGALDERPKRLLDQVRGQRIEQGLRDADAAVEVGDFAKGLMLIQKLRAAVPAEWTGRIEAAFQQVTERGEAALAAKLKEEEERAEREQAAIAAGLRQKEAQAERERIEKLESEKSAKAAKQREEEEHVAQVEKKRLQQAERDKAAEAAKQREEREHAAQLESERVAQVEKERLEQAERDKSAEAAKQREEQEHAAQLESERVARVEKKRLEQAERDKAAQAAKLRQEQEHAAQVESERVARVEKRRLEQAERDKAAQAAKLRQEQEHAAQVESERVARVEKKRLEQAERDKSAEAAKLRQEQEHAAQVESERVARIEQERLQQAERDKAAQATKLRQEQERAAAQIERERVARIEQERLQQAERDKAAQAAKLREEQERAAAQNERKRVAQIEQERLQQAERDNAVLAAKWREEQERATQIERERVARAEQERLARFEINRPAPQPSPTRSFPTKLAAGVAAAIAAIVGSILLIPRLMRAPDGKQPTLVALEVRSDPPGASVKVAGQSCVTPFCRLHVAPGDYKVEASLKGYKPEAKSINVPSAASTPPVIEFSLLPVPPDLPPIKEGAALGTLIVKAGIPDALVIIDNAPRNRTGADGSLTIQLQAKNYEVNVQKRGYENPTQKRVQITADRSHTVTFTLTQQNATLQLRGAPSGVELRVNGSLIGKTDGALVFSLPVRPAAATLQVALGSGKRELPEMFEAGQTLTLEWASIAPSASAGQKPPVVEPSRAELEAQAWERASKSTDPADIGKYVAEYPNSSHSKEAQAKLDDLAWARTNLKDEASVRAYLNRFPSGAHARDASTQISELAWNGTAKNNVQALKTYLDQFAGGTHEREARELIDRLEKQRTDAEARAREAESHNKEDRLKQEQLRADAQVVQTVVEQFNGAFSSPNPKKAFNEIWPNAPAIYTAYIPGDKKEKVVLSLSQCGSPAVNGSTAVAPCTLTSTGFAWGKPRPTATGAVNLNLQKRADRWIITGVSRR